MKFTKPTQTRAEIIAALPPVIDTQETYDENDHDNPHGLTPDEMFDAIALRLSSGARASLYAASLAAKEKPDSTTTNAAKGEPDKTTANAPTTKTRVNKIAKAIGLLACHPDWTNRAIAAEAGCTPETLSRSPKYRAARAAIRKSGASGTRRASQHRGTDMDSYEDE